ncbi:MAG: ABC transporter permease, partial [Anaerolineaceae bacterium]
MNTIVTVIKHEFTSAVFRRSFLIMLLLVPLVGLGVMLFTSYANGDGQESAVGNMFSTEMEPTVDGYIDHSGLIQALPDNLEDTLVPFTDEAAAMEAIRRGEINGYYVIPAEYMTTGALEYIQSDYSPFAGLESSGTIEDVIRFNLLGQDQTLADRVNKPMTLQVNLLSGQTQRDPNEGLTFFLPYIVTFLFYFIIFGS